MAKRTQRIRTFRIKGENGKAYRVSEFVNIEDAGHSQAPNAEIRGLRRLKTEDGWSVTPLGEGRYHVVGVDGVFTEDDS
jgi:hypothetical protein